MEAAGVRALFDGVVVRIDREIDLLAIAPGLAQFAERTGLAVLGAIKLTDASIARCRDDDVDTARLAAEALLAARLSPRVRYVFDTFMDVDRGYFPRNGFIDRMFNPRPALRAYAAMAHLLGRDNSVTVEPAVREGTAQRVRFCVSGAPHFLVSGMDRASAGALAREAGAGEVLDLCTGEFTAPEAGSGETKHGVWVLTNVANFS